MAVAFCVLEKRGFYFCVDNKTHFSAPSLTRRLTITDCRLARETQKLEEEHSGLGESRANDLCVIFASQKKQENTREQGIVSE
jgi:hypothetical protein